MGATADHQLMSGARDYAITQGPSALAYGGLTISDQAHHTRLERQREERRQRHQVEVEIRPLYRYDQ